MIEYADEQRINAIADSRVALAFSELSKDLRERADAISDRSVAEALRFVAAAVDWRTK